MIDEKVIENIINGAIDKSMESVSADHPIRDLEVTFRTFALSCAKATAEFVQNEFINSLWHDASEAPKDYTDIIYVDGDNDVWNEDTYYADNYDDLFCKGWQSFVSSRDVVKWCYADDIMPKKGGKG